MSEYMKTVFFILMTAAISGCSSSSSSSSISSTKTPTPTPAPGTGPTQLQFTTSPQSLAETSLCSGAVTVQVEDSDGAPFDVTSDLTVSLTSSQGLAFYSDAACTAAVTSVAIASGSHAQSFYLKATKVGSTLFTATASGVSSASQAITSASHTLYMGLQGSDGHSYVQVLHFNPTDNTYSVDASSEYRVDDGTRINADELRAFTVLDDGHLLLGAFTGINTRYFDVLTKTLSDALSFNGAGLSGLTGVCQLPNGHFFGAPWGSGATQTVREFDSSGAYLRDVITLNNTMFQCRADSSTSVFLVDYNGNSDNYGKIIRMSFDGANWSMADSLDATTITAGNSRYGFVLHTNGKVYLPPQNPETNIATKQMLACGKTDLANSCASEGDDITVGTGIQTGDVDCPQGIVQIPGSDDMLVASNLSSSGSAVLLRYNPSTGHYTPLTSSSGSLPTNISNSGGVRGLHLR